MSHALVEVCYKCTEMNSMRVCRFAQIRCNSNKEHSIQKKCQLYLNRYIDIDVCICVAIKCHFHTIEMQMRAIETDPPIIIGSMVAVLFRSLSEVLSFFIFSIFCFCFVLLPSPHNMY